MRLARDGAGERDSAGWFLFGCRDGTAGPNGLLVPWENRLPQNDVLTKTGIPGDSGRYSGREDPTGWKWTGRD
ncbi:hypothetical protein chiPu_0027909 [Chiloscyllium punctatum]|uniref:Uncharacterized protein n=1 Tax=Chiloscyllium punctatum TaxID=137246 RepID=A0A401TMQ9_CHIPU|nr:hypothetical protein [Chiloscyllium punctatum]